MLELAAQERRERRLPRHRRAGAGHEQPDGRAVGVVGRIERRDDANAGLRGRGREQGQDDEGHAHRAILAVCEDRGMTVTDALPVYHHREHHSIWIDAPPEAALAAARETRPEDVPLVSMLFRLRGLRSGRDTPIWTSMQARGFRLHDPETLTLIGRPWTRGGGLRAGEDFLRFSEPGYAKMAMDLRALPDGEGARLETETRVFLTDAAARRRFGAYWLVVRPFSGLIRRRWLRAAKQRAER